MPKFARPTSYNGRKATQQLTGDGRFATLQEALAGVSTTLIISPATMQVGTLSMINGSLPIGGNFIIQADTILGIPQGITVNTPALGGPANSTGISAFVDGVTIVIDAITGEIRAAAPTALSFSFTTVNAATATSVDIPIPANQATSVYVLFTVINSTFTLAASDIAQGCARDLAGAVSIVNSDFIDVSIQEDIALGAIDFALNPGGAASTVRISVTGIAGQTLNWKALVTLTSTP